MSVRPTKRRSAHFEEHNLGVGDEVDLSFGGEGLFRLSVVRDMCSEAILQGEALRHPARILEDSGDESITISRPVNAEDRRVVEFATGSKELVLGFRRNMVKVTCGRI